MAWIHCPNCGYGFLHPSEPTDYQFTRHLPMGVIEQPMYCRTCDDYTLHQNGVCMRCSHPEVTEEEP